MHIGISSYFIGTVWYLERYGTVCRFQVPLLKVLTVEVVTSVPGRYDRWYGNVLGKNWPGHSFYIYGTVFFIYYTGRQVFVNLSIIDLDLHSEWTYGSSRRRNHCSTGTYLIISGSRLDWSIFSANIIRAQVIFLLEYDADITS